MCSCQLIDGVHWYVDLIHAPLMYMVGRSPEQAEAALRTWAAKVLVKGTMQLDMRPTAAKILATKVLEMKACCEAKILHPHNMDF